MFVPAVAGLGLMILPYFFSSAFLMSVVCVVLIVLPFVFRDL